MGSYKRIWISSEVVDLHGVMLRDALRKAFWKFAETERVIILGQISNQELGVEILFDCSEILDDGKYKELIKRTIERNELIEPDFKNEISINIEDSYGAKPNFSQFKGLALSRSSEDKEMVWALQGAGRMFKNISEQIADRDYRKLIGHLSGLKYEIYFNRDEVRIKEGTEFDGFHTRALENFLINMPPEVTDEKFIEMLQEYLALCRNNHSYAELLEVQRKIVDLSKPLEDAIDSKIQDLEHKTKTLKKSEDK